MDSNISKASAVGTGKQPALRNFSPIKKTGINSDLNPRMLEGQVGADGQLIGDPISCTAPNQRDGCIPVLISGMTNSEFDRIKDKSKGTSVGLSSDSH